MKQKYSVPTLVINIEREYFAEIPAIPRRKDVEYRNIKKYWTDRLDRVGKPPVSLPAKPFAGRCFKKGVSHVNLQKKAGY